MPHENSTPAAEIKALASAQPTADDGRHHVVGLSGGKDSCAMALELARTRPGVPFVFFCTPTGDELPEMQAHWARLEASIGSPIVYLRNGTLDSWIEHFKALPNSRQRWCTRLLKIEPCLAFLSLLSDPVLYVGLRADEEERQGLYSSTVETRFPLREWGWGLPEVLAACERFGVQIPRRTDCARCYEQRLDEWQTLYREHPEIYAHAEEQERAVSAHRDAPITFRSRTRDTWPAGLADLRGKWEAGHWLRGEAERRQGDLFGGGIEPGACRVCKL